MSDNLKRKKQTKERGVTILSTKEQHETLESYKAEQRNTYVRVMLMVNIVFILLLITIAVIALKVSNVLPEGSDIFYIVGKDPSLEITDQDDKKWRNEEYVDIFKTEHKNGEGQITVASQDGDKIIAPGTTTKYMFALFNDGNVALKYETDIDFSLTLNGEETHYSHDFPLLVRLSTDEDGGRYLMGSETEWVSVSKAKIDSYVSQLGASSYEHFTLEIKWEYESGNDELDTLLGNLSAEGSLAGGDGVVVTMGINAVAEEHIDPEAEGGTKIQENGQPVDVEHGGTIRWIWLILLFLNIAMIIFYISWILNKRMNKW